MAIYIFLIAVINLCLGFLAARYFGFVGRTFTERRPAPYDSAAIGEPKEPDFAPEPDIDEDTSDSPDDDLADDDLANYTMIDERTETEPVET